MVISWGLKGEIYIFLGEIMVDRCNGCNVATFIMVDTLLTMFNYHEKLMADTTSLSTARLEISRPARFDDTRG